MSHGDHLLVDDDPSRGGGDDVDLLGPVVEVVVANGLFAGWKLDLRDLEGFDAAGLADALLEEAARQ